LSFEEYKTTRGTKCKKRQGRDMKEPGAAPQVQVAFLPCRSAEGATPDIGSRSIVNEPLLFILLRIFSARISNRGRYWAVGPGYYISRLQRFIRSPSLPVL
jgi:hypothetical protein